MKLKVIYTVALILSVSILRLHAQINLVVDGSGCSGAPLSITNDTLFVIGNIKVTGNTEQARNIHNAGTIFITDSIINGVNNLFYSSSNPYIDNVQKDPLTYGEIIFNGTKEQYVTGNEVIYFNNILLNNPNHLFLNTNIKSFGTVSFNNGFLQLNGHNLDLFDTDPYIMRLGGNLQNEGELHRVVDLMHSANTSNYVRAYSPSISNPVNVGNLGAEVSRATGNIIVERGHVPITEVNGTSLPWFFNFYSDNTNDNEQGSVVLHYRDYDFTNLDYDESSISIFSINRDLLSSPKIHETTVNEASNTAEATELNLLKRYFISNSECDSDIGLTLVSDTNVCLGVSVTLNPLEGFENTDEYFCEWYLVNEENNLEMIGAEQILSVTPLSEGPVTYVVHAANQMGCEGTDSVTVFGRPLPDADFHVVPFTCENDSIILNNNSFISSGELFYTWDFGDNSISDEITPHKTYSEYGDYQLQLKVVSEYQCTDSTNITLSVHDNPVTDFTYEKVCNSHSIKFINNTSLEEGEINESIWESVAGVITNINSGSMDDAVFTFDQPGTYEIQLITANRLGNCRDSITRIVELIPNDIPEFEYERVCFEDETHFTNTSVTEGESAIFTWTFNDQGISTDENPVYTFIEPGIHNVELTIDNNNCDTSISKLITIHELPYAGFTFENSCSREIVEFFNLTEDSLTYSWTSGDQTSDEPNPYFSFDTEGEYEVILEVTSSVGCVDTAINQILIYPLPEASFISNNACFGDTNYFENTSSIRSNENLVSYWDFGDVNYSEDTNPYHQYSNDYGIKEVILIVTSDSGCTDTIIQEVEIYRNPSVGFMPEEQTCGDSLILIPQEEASHYYWQDGSNEPEYTVYDNGYYWVRITDDNGCEDTDTIYIVLYDDVVIPLPDETSNCGPVTLDAGYFPGDSYYEWSTGETTQNITATESGVYEVVVIDQNGCTDTAQCYTTIHEIPYAEIIANVESCLGLTEEVMVLTDADSIVWNIASTGELISNTDHIQITESGLIQVTVVSSDYCEVQDETTITFFEPPQLYLEDNITGCNEALLDTRYNGPEYLWSTGESTSTIIVAESGKYWVEVTNDKDCKASDTSIVYLEYIQELDLGDDIYKCEYESVTIEGTGFGDEYNYNWNTGLNTKAIVAASEGLYSLTVSVGDLCQTTDTVEVFNSESPYAELDRELYLCDNSEIISPVYTNNVAEYIWYFNDLIIGYDEQQEIHEPGKYWVKMSNEIGCNITDTINVLNTDNKIDALFLVADSLKVGDTLEIFNASSSFMADFQWDFGDGHIVNQMEGPKHVYYSEGDYTITLMASTGECTDIFQKSRTVKGFDSGLKSLQFSSKEIPGLVEFLNSKLYPNPALDRVTLELEINIPSQLYLSIFDINGRAIHFEKINVEGHYAQEFNFSNVPGGIYFIRVSSLNSSIIHKVIVVK